MSRKYLAKDLTVLNNSKIKFLYYKYITNNHFHLQCLIEGKLHYFVIQAHKNTIDIYDARNVFLHSFKREPIPPPKTGEAISVANSNMNDAISIIKNRSHQTCLLYTSPSPRDS